MAQLRRRAGGRIPAALLTLTLLLIAGCGGGSGTGPAEEVAPVEFRTFESGNGLLGNPPRSLALSGDVPGLVKFDLAYDVRSHHVAKIVAGGQSLGRFHLDMTDETPIQDSTTTCAKYMDLRGISRRHLVEGHGLRGIARIPLDAPLGPDELFVLSGFGFWSQSEPTQTDHKIQKLRVTPFPRSGYVEVEYRDRSPQDDTYSAGIAYAIIPADRGVESSLRPHFDGTYSSQFRFRGTGQTTRIPGAALLHGFSLEFLNDDHNLRQVAIDLHSTNLIRVAFHDGDLDHHDAEVSASVSYVLVNPGDSLLR